jgi:hypothetical protein
MREHAVYYTGGQSHIEFWADKGSQKDRRVLQMLQGSDLDSFLVRPWPFALLHSLTAHRVFDWTEQGSVQVILLKHTI